MNAEVKWLCRFWKPVASLFDFVTSPRIWYTIWHALHRQCTISGIPSRRQRLAAGWFWEVKSCTMPDTEIHHWIFTKALDFKPALQADILSVICSLLTAQSCFRDIFLKQAGNPHSLPKPDLLVPPPTCCHVNSPSTSWAPSASKHAHELPRWFRRICRHSGKQGWECEVPAVVPPTVVLQFTKSTAKRLLDFWRECHGEKKEHYAASSEQVTSE